MTDLQPSDGRDTWEITVVSEPFTTGSEDVDTAVDRLQDHARQRDWDVVIGLTELPLHDQEGRHLLVESDPAQRTSVLSLPALGGLRMHSRARRAVRSLVDAMADPDADEEHRRALPRRRGRWRLLLGMVLANRPWRLVPGLKSALVAALATGAVATINSTVWLLAGSLSWWRLVVATFVSIALVVGWLVIDGKLWDRPDGDSPQARERSRLYNASTLVTLTAGVLICYLALYVLNLLWAWFVLDPKVMGGFLRTPRSGTTTFSSWLGSSPQQQPSAVVSDPASSQTRPSVLPHTPSVRRSGESVWHGNGTRTTTRIGTRTMTETETNTATWTATRTASIPPGSRERASTSNDGASAPECPRVDPSVDRPRVHP